MIPGVVNGNLEATVRLLVRGPGGQEQEIEAVIDTGFNGFLTLSPVLVRRLGLPHLGQSRALLASGQEEILDLYEVTLVWDGQWRTVEADAADTDASVGMLLLYRYSVYVEAVEPTFKGSECPYRFFWLRALHTTRSRDRAHHRPTGERLGPQRAA